MKLLCDGSKRHGVLLTLLLCSLALIPVRVEANTITLGEIELSGTITLNPAYTFNQPTSQPFGSFSGLTIVEASGIFTPLMHHGGALSMNTPQVLSPPFTALAESKPLAGQMIWSVGGYTMDTTWTNITGADFVGRNVFGLFDLSGHHFDRALTTLGAYGSWDFIAPPYDISNFTQPVTGPITLTIHEAFTNGGVGRGGNGRGNLTALQAFSKVPLDPNNLTIHESSNNGHVVPEPSSFFLLAWGLALLTGWRSRKTATEGARTASEWFST